ncbi:MAG: YeiH family protein [Fimbriimonadales bacterium]
MTSSPARKAIFVISAAACLFTSPPIALALGILFALTLGNPYPSQTSKVQKTLLQACVVGLGFGMNLQSVLGAGRTGFVFTVATIAGTLVLGYIVGTWMGLGTSIRHLISSGTAICGGSAIAAVGSAMKADAREMSVSLATVFVLNAIGLFLFPLLGHLFDLSQTQFGIWSAIAIHDTSSVVGAASRYGAEALEIATTVKLARALWIIPLALVTAFAFHRKGAKIAIPYFIFLFILASILRTYVPPIQEVSDTIVAIAKIGLTLTLFLIGAGLSRAALQSVGVKPLAFGVILWAAISVTSLVVVINTL